MIEFNINTPIKVKLTSYGARILMKYCENHQSPFETMYPVDENGYTNIQLIEAMIIFGPYFISYDPKRPKPFENNIMISEQYLKTSSIENGISR